MVPAKGRVMRRVDIVRKVARRLHVRETVASSAIDATLHEIQKAVLRGKPVKLTGFGVFDVPGKGHKPVFRPGSAFVRALESDSPESVLAPATFHAVWVGQRLEHDGFKLTEGGRTWLADLFAETTSVVLANAQFREAPLKAMLSLDRLISVVEALARQKATTKVNAQIFGLALRGLCPMWPFCK